MSENEILPGYLTALDEIEKGDKEDSESSLLGYLQRKFTESVHHRDRICVTDRLYNAHYSSKGHYSPCQLMKLEVAKSPKVHFGLFSRQRRSALAWYEDLLSQIKDKPWIMKASPIAVLPEEAKNEIINKITQDIVTGSDDVSVQSVTDALKTEHELTARLVQEKADNAAQRASKVIEDRLTDGGWSAPFKEFRNDLMTYCNAFLLSPELIREPKMVYSGNKVKVEDKTVYATRCISPFAVFPTADCTSTQDGEGIFIVDEMSRNALLRMKGMPGSDDDSIDEVLKVNNGWWAGTLAYPSGAASYLVENELTYADVRYLAGNDEHAGNYSIIRFFGDVAPEMLDGFKIKTLKDDIKRPTIPVEIWMCAGEIVRAVRNNHPSGKRPIHTAGYEEVSRSFWKRGLYDILEDVERRINKATRELVSHTGASLGFFGELDMTRMGRNPIGNELPLNKILRTDGDYTRGGQPALRLHSIDSKIGEAMRLIEKYEKEAEDTTGIRSFMSGATDLGVAGRTNGVVNALQTNSSKLIVMTQGNVNTNVVAEIVRYFYELELFYGKDKSIRGDLQIVVQGSDGLAAQEVFEAKFEKIMQYGSSLYTMPGPDGLPMIDPRDVQIMHNRYFEMNGVDLRYTNRPGQKINYAPSTTMGTGGMPQIDGRSDPANISGGAGPISPV